MEKFDFKKTYKDLFTASSKKIKIVDVPEFNFLTYIGKGSPGGTNFAQGVEALYSVSYNLKFFFKKNEEKDYGVPPLQGLWWAKDMGDFVKMNKDNWIWQIMLMQPDFISDKKIKETIQDVKKKKDNPALDLLELKSFDEGKCAQIMHVGPYDKEGPTIKFLHEEIKKAGFSLRDKHHEIYLGDPRKAAPEKLKTIIRQPIK